jgi:hypothetical protein
MEFKLSFKRPPNTLCCLECEAPLESRGLEGECGLCFEDEACGCRFCELYITGWDDHVKGRCALAWTLRRLKAFGLRLESMKSDKGVWYEFHFLKKFPENVFRGLISVLKLHGFQYFSETCGWGRDFKDDQEAFKMLQPVYESLKEVLNHG